MRHFCPAGQPNSGYVHISVIDLDQLMRAEAERDRLLTALGQVGKYLETVAGTGAKNLEEVP